MNSHIDLVGEDAVALGVISAPSGEKGETKIALISLQNVTEPWQALGLLIQAVAATASDLSQGGNPEGITDYEGMASYVCENITKMIMSSIVVRSEDEDKI